jgi:hypothetical protein
MLKWKIWLLVLVIMEVASTVFLFAEMPEDVPASPPTLQGQLDPCGGMGHWYICSP